MPATKVVILGAGFAGIAAAKAVAKSPQVAVTLIDRNRFQVYYPSLYELATEEITRQTPIIPLQEIFAGTGVKLVRGEIVAVDKAKRQVQLRDKTHFDYDYLVVALGAVSNDFGIRGVRERALMFREYQETMLLRSNIHTLMRLANEQGRQEINLVICGGGFSGIELAAELRWHCEKLSQHYRCQQINMTVVEAGPQILPGMPESVAKTVSAKLKKLAIKVDLGDPVTEIAKDGVRLKSGGWVSSDLTIWTAGTKPNPLVDSMGLPLDPKGRPVVNDYLHLIGRPELYVVGDLAGFTDPTTGQGIPPQAYHAMAMGKVAGQNILRSISKLPLLTFRPESPSFIVPIGHNDALLVRGTKVTAGWWPSLLKHLVEFSYLFSLFGPFKAWGIFWNDVKAMAE